MNILFLNSIGANKWGGGEKWMVEAARGLQARGHTVFIGSKRHSHILQRAEQAGLRTVVFHIRGDFSPLNTLKIARFLRRELIDCLICNLNKDVRVGALAARWVHTPVVLARHGVKLIGKKTKHRCSLRLVDGIITNATSIQQEYASYGWFPPDFVRVIHNGMSVPPLPIETSVREDLGLSHDTRLVLAAGRLTEQKGFDVLIRAAQLACQEGRQDVRFLIAGKGRLLGQLRSQVAEGQLENYVAFLGFVQDLKPYLAACDLFALPSRFEGMPNAVMEAMAVGKPVVATSVNGTRELVVDGQVGYLVPPEQSASLWQKIRHLLDHPDLARQMGQAGRLRVQNCFSYERMIDQLDGFLCEKLANSGRMR